jgi:hypothetical protein
LEKRRSEKSHSIIEGFKMIFKNIKRFDLYKENKIISYFVLFYHNGTKEILTNQQFLERKK